VDFREAGEERYRQELRKLVGGLLGKADGRALPELPAELAMPSWPTGRSGSAIRHARQRAAGYGVCLAIFLREGVVLGRRSGFRVRLEARLQRLT
jgi:hypothetical protein